MLSDLYIIPEFLQKLIIRIISWLTKCSALERLPLPLWGQMRASWRTGHIKECRKLIPIYGTCRDFCFLFCLEYDSGKVNQTTTEVNLIYYKNNKRNGKRLVTFKWCKGKVRCNSVHLYLYVPQKQITKLFQIKRNVQAVCLF